MHETDLGKITTQPANYFSSPMKLVECNELEPNAKLIALKEWEFEVRQIAVASEESMNASATTTLKDVHDAMRALGHEPGDDTDPGGKA
tara:strand:- start:4586 stop:4852 length:267 start_codon:yes stop_codon:yes gene_type:complete